MIRLYVRLTPKSSKDAIEGWSEDEKGRPVLRVRVRAAPIEGQANTAMIALLAKALGLPKSYIRLGSGDTSRLKALDIEGMDDAEIQDRLGLSCSYNRFSHFRTRQLPPQIPGQLPRGDHRINRGIDGIGFRHESQ